MKIKLEKLKCELQTVSVELKSLVGQLMVKRMGCPSTSTPTRD